MKIGIFDSGIGGQAVAERLHELIPSAKIISINDRANMPYGNKTNDQIIELTLSAIRPLIDLKCDAIVIACNTATTVAIDNLRIKYPNSNFIGLEPMIKPAAELTQTKSILVLATPATLNSYRYQHLKKNWGKNINIIEPDCSDWANLIEFGRSEEINIKPALEQLRLNDADVVVLACTHYHWLIKRIKDELDNHKVQILEPSDAIARRISELVG